MESSALFARPHDCTEDFSSNDEALIATIDNGIELIKDRVSQLSWEDVERLVAGLFKAMGYCARVTPKCPDDGRYVIASPGAPGFESPRIAAEVKRCKGAMGAPTARSFIGGLGASDRGPYVSTGGFTKEARYEADRANGPCVCSTSTPSFATTLRSTTRPAASSHSPAFACRRRNSKA